MTHSEAIIFVNTEVNKLACMTKEEKAEEMINFTLMGERDEEMVKICRQELAAKSEDDLKDDEEFFFKNEWNFALERGETAKKLFEELLAF